MPHPFLPAILALAANLTFLPIDATATVPRSEEDGWRILFDGSSTEGWRNGDGSPYDDPIDDGTLQVFQNGGAFVYHEDVFEDFILRCEVKQETERTNSGVFVRLVDPKTHHGPPSRNPRTGFECQVGPGGTGIHSFGAIYDLVPAASNVARPAGEWNEIEIRCQGPIVTVSVNGTQTATLNTEEWPEPTRRPDGSRHKFLTAIKDHPRVGHIAFQDHGARAWYRNVRIKELKAD
ncbi:3-keto-disaccharide hydrolase [Tautonia marina]|uniref:3-keto-disaccharide hydrolase n=1 Tax=Tautonia marina TaxID=2653855 RepID=UPI0013762A2D|nr:DUF1080 domain-containing protein [Tautonia marina]